jgi:hypothetical protein
MEREVMAKRSTSTSVRNSPAAELRPPKKATKPRVAKKLVGVTEPELPTDPLDEALVETFPASDAVAIGLSDRIGEPAPAERPGLVGDILRLLGLGKR